MDVQLPPKLDALLAAEPDQDFAARLRMVCDGAARTIGALGDFDLVQYEAAEGEESADLSTWEQVAPVIASTISDVNTLGAQVEASFPPGALVMDGKQLEVERVVTAAAKELKTDVMHFGMRVRDPQVVGDRWNLITELQVFRARFRDRIGRMVFEAASCLGDCKRREVEPGYEANLGSTLVVRSMGADLRRKLHARILRVTESAPGEMVDQAQQIERELDTFARTAAWRTLRAQDKRGILEFRARLRALVAQGVPAKVEVLGVLEPFVEFIDTFAEISRRELLVEHDQEALASIGLILERAMTVDGYEAKVAAFKEALQVGQTLYGKSPDFDGFLRAHRLLAPGPEQLGASLEHFLVQLAGLSQY